MRAAVLVTALLAGLVAPAAAAASSGTWGLASDGHPRLEIPSFGIEVRVCPPNEACRALDTDGSGFVEPGGTVPGSVFEAEDASGIERSLPWQGRVTSTGAPGVAGDLVAGGTVRPVAGSWSGGWGDDLSHPTLVVCPTTAGTDCEWLPSASTPIIVSGAGPGVIGAQHAGRYLFAVDYRSPRDTLAMPVPQLYSPAHRFALPAPEQRVAVSAPVGPIAGAPGPAPPVSTPPPAAAAPKVTLRSRALRSRGRVTLGSVTCAARCSVKLSVADGRRTLRRTLSVRGTSRLSIVRGALLHRGRLLVKVTVDGKPLASGRVRL